MPGGRSCGNTAKPCARSRPSNPMWLEARAVDLLQGELAARCMAEHACDEVRLHSAVIEPQRTTDSDLAQAAADHACALLRNRPFAHGNEAAAFLATALFLQLNGH